MIKKKNSNAKPAGVRIVVLLVLALAVLGGIAVGATIAFNRLDAIWTEQFRVTDRDLDVVITSGKRVHPEIITLTFGLTNGANLAEIPFARKRADLLERFPNIRDIRIERRLPQRVNIEVIEREPAVRVVSKNVRGENGRVADIEGVVFRFAGETGTLPAIYESTDTPTLPGKKLSGLAAAALLLVETASAPEFPDFRIRAVETSAPDYLLVTLSNQDTVQLAWDHMLDRSPASRKSLARQIENVQSVIRTQLYPHPTLWLATDWNKPYRVTASNPSRAR